MRRVAWQVPRIESAGELAAWLNVSASELEWFADLKRMNARTKVDRSTIITIACWQEER